MDRVQEARRRHWADVAAIVGGVMAFAFTVWPSDLFTLGNAQRSSLSWLSYALPGVMAVGSVFLANRSRTLARVVLALAGLILLGSLIGTAQFGWQHWVSRIIPALLMLGAAPFVGRMPTPAEDHIG